MDDALWIEIPTGFSLADIEALSGRLSATGGVVSGPMASSNALDPTAIFSLQKLHGWRFQLLPDRNLVTRLAAVAQHGSILKDDKPTRFAVDMMAFCQAMDIEIEPSIAYHELAHRESNATAHDELRWFRPADRNNFLAWVDLAQGRRTKLELGEPAPLEPIDLAFPLRRWRRNYIAALKIAELELSTRTPADRARELMRWMFEEFMLAGPAMVFALFYLAPRGPKAGLMKGLRSQNPEKRIAGIRNAAWDITQLSEFIRRVGESDSTRTQYLFATADEGLSRIAQAVLSTTDKNEEWEWLGDQVAPYWGAKLAEDLVAHYHSYTAREKDPSRPPPNTSPDFIENCIARGEALVRAAPGK